MSTSRQNKLPPELKQTKEYYETHAEEWMARKGNPFVHEHRFRDFVDRLKKKASVLDIGCAGGVFIPLFLGIGRTLKYYGIDLSPTLIRVAKRRYPQLTFAVGNLADAATLPRKKFDGFVLSAVLMHLPYSLWETGCKNIESRMHSGAAGYVVLPTDAVSYEHDENDTRHFTILTEEAILKFLKERNWKVLKKYRVENHRGDWRAFIVRLPRSKKKTQKNR